MSTHSDLFVSEKIDLLLEYAVEEAGWERIEESVRILQVFKWAIRDRLFAAAGRNKGKKNVSKIERRTLRSCSCRRLCPC